MKSVFAAAAFVGAAGLLLTSSAQATAIVTGIGSSPGYINSLPGVITFEEGPGGYVAADSALGYDWTGTGQVFGPPSTGNGAVPFGDTSNFYMSVLGGSEATLSVNTGLLNTTGLSSLSLFIGSLDTYNSITFWSGGSSQTLSGTDLLNSIPTSLGNSGNQGSDETNRYFTFAFDSSTPVDKIVFDSSTNSFEFDNLTPVTITTNGNPGGLPEPSVWIVMLAGFTLLGLALRSRTINGFVGAQA